MFPPVSAGRTLTVSPWPIWPHHFVAQIFQVRSSPLSRRMSQSANNLDATKLPEEALEKLLLQERRTALLFAAVTGKIDVHPWQPPEP